MAYFIQSERGGRKLVDEHNYIYRIHSKNADKSKIYWRCEVERCRARAQTLVFDEPEISVVTTGQHRHSAMKTKIEAIKAVRAMKGSTKTCEPGRSLVSRHCSSLQTHSLAVMPTSATLYRNIRRWRQLESSVPPIPQERTGFVIPNEYCNLETGDLFLQYDSGSEDRNRILIFATCEGLDNLARYPDWAGDGTFKVCPSFFYQLYTIHVHKRGTVLPCVYALLPNKKTETYNRLFENIVLLRPNIRPETCMLDYEQAVMTALTLKFPDILLTGCLFHFAQSIYRKIVELGYKTKYNEDAEFRQAIKCLTKHVLLYLLPEYSFSHLIGKPKRTVIYVNILQAIYFIFIHYISVL